MREASSRLLIFIRVWSMTHSTLVSPQPTQNFFNLPNNGLPRTWRLSVEAYGQCFVAVSEKQSLQILVNLPFTNIKALFVPSASSWRGYWQRHCGWGKNIWSYDKWADYEKQRSFRRTDHILYTGVGISYLLCDQIYVCRPDQVCFESHFKVTSCVNSGILRCSSKRSAWKLLAPLTNSSLCLCSSDVDHDNPVL